MPVAPCSRRLTSLHTPNHSAPAHVLPARCTTAPKHTLGGGRAQTSKQLPVPWSCICSWLSSLSRRVHPSPHLASHVSLYTHTDPNLPHLAAVDCGAKTLCRLAPPTLPYHHTSTEATSISCCRAALLGCTRLALSGAPLEPSSPPIYLVRNLTSTFEFHAQMTIHRQALEGIIWQSERLN